MSSRDAILQAFLDGLWTAGDAVALRSVADRAARQLGFDWFAYLNLAETGPILISTYSRAWTDHYFARGYERIDPVVRGARARTALFAWDGGSAGAARGPEQRRLFSDAEDFGIRCGVTIPIRGAFGRFAALTFAGGRTDRDFAGLLEHSGDLLQLMGLYLHARAELALRERDVSRGPALSQREAECLAWAARGKTMVETGEIVGLRPRTIAFHLENARVKLDAANVTQAVAQAVRRRLIP